MKLPFTYCPLSTTPCDVSENEVRINGSQFLEIIAVKASIHQLHPWKSRVVSISTESGKLYRLLRGHGILSIKKNECLLGPKTRTQLGISTGTVITIERAWRVWGRLAYYWSHIDDIIRMGARIGIIGLAFAIVSIMLSLFQIWLALR